MKRLKLNVVHQFIFQPHVHCCYFFGKCVEQESLISPLTHPGALYIQLVRPSLLLIPVVGSAGQSPPAEPDWMKPFFPSMVEPIVQLVLPVRTVRYLSSLEEVFCRTCNQLTPLTKWIVDLGVNSFFGYFHFKYFVPLGCLFDCRRARGILWFIGIYFKLFLTLRFQIAVFQ